jgi:hypothetical protein
MDGSPAGNLERPHPRAGIEIISQFGFDAGPTVRVNNVCGLYHENHIGGGQTGADRVALDFAIERGILHGGWCPKIRLVEGGLIDTRYHSATTRAEPRTEASDDCRPIRSRP